MIQNDPECWLREESEHEVCLGEERCTAGEMMRKAEGQVTESEANSTREERGDSDHDGGSAWRASAACEGR